MTLVKLAKGDVLHVKIKKLVKVVIQFITIFKRVMHAYAIMPNILWTIQLIVYAKMAIINKQDNVRIVLLDA